MNGSSITVKEVCLAEEAKFKKEMTILKVRLSLFYWHFSHWVWLCWLGLKTGLQYAAGTFFSSLDWSL